MAYPTATAIAEYLVRLGFLDAVPENLTDITLSLNASIECFEKEAMWSPYLIETMTYTTYYNFTKRGSLDLPFGIKTVSSISVDDTVLPESGYQLGGLTFDREVYTMLWVGDRDGLLPLSITGELGRVSTVPSVVYKGIQNRAAGTIIDQETKNGGLIRREKNGPYEVEFAAGVVAGKTQASPIIGFRSEMAHSWDEAIKFARRKDII